VATATGYKAVTDSYETSWHDVDGVCDGAKAFTLHAITYTVGATATPDPAFPGLHIWVDDPDTDPAATAVLPSGSGALRRAIGTAQMMEVAHLSGGGPGTVTVPGTRGRVVQVEYDTADVLPIWTHFDSLPTDPYTRVVRVTSCDVVAEYDLDA
jgi:hypothetical protein